MSTRLTRGRTPSEAVPIRDLRRLGNRIGQVKASKAPLRDVGQALVLLDELTVLLGTLMQDARELGGQITALQQGLAATTAYRRAGSLAPTRKQERQNVQNPCR